MIYGFESMYRILNKYVENNMSEIEHAFVMELKWPDSFRISGLKNGFWIELQKLYDITLTEEEKKAVKTVEDLKNTLIRTR